jgi:hypothetical protein
LAKQRVGSLNERGWLQIPRNEFTMEQKYYYKTEAEIRTYMAEKDDKIAEIRKILDEKKANSQNF